MTRTILAAVAEPTIRAAHPHDRDALTAFLAALSPASAYQRFLTGLSATPPARLVAALLPERPRGGALFALLGDKVVGHGLWARLPGDAAAEIAVVVSDRHQRRGIGTALARAVTDDLLAHGVTDVEVFSSTDNRAVARMVARAAPDARRRLDGATSTYLFRPTVGAAPLPATA